MNFIRKIVKPLNEEDTQLYNELKNLLNVSKKRRMNKPKKESMPINVQSGEIPTLPNATSYQLKIQKKYEDYLEKLNSTSGGLHT